MIKIMTAEKLRKELQIPEDFSLRDFFMGYFQERLDDLINRNLEFNKSNMDKKLKNRFKHSVIHQYGIVIGPYFILNQCGLSDYVLPKDYVKQEIEVFVENLIDLGFIVKLEQDRNSEYVKNIHISWCSINKSNQQLKTKLLHLKTK